MSDPQPLTDEEANHYWMVRRPNYDCTACRAIARIRADGRRIKILEHEIDCMSSSLDAIGDMEGPCAKEARRVLKMLDDESDTLAALEDKTK